MLTFNDRPPLMNPTPGPGPGAYPIKTTLGKLMESHIKSPSQFTLRGRTKFGDPNEKSMSKTTANEPGYLIYCSIFNLALSDIQVPKYIISVLFNFSPGQYDLTGKFLSGSNPRKSAFPKGGFVRDKSQLTPGPGSYKPMESMGKQVLSTCETALILKFSQAARPSMVPPGNYILTHIKCWYSGNNAHALGTSDIGPGDYKPPPAACDPQVDSRKPTCATIKFGEGYKRGGAVKKFDLSEPSPG